MPLDVKTMKDTRELVESGFSIGGKFALDMIDFIVAALNKEEEKKEPKNTKITKKHKDSFMKRFEEDDCDNMTEDQWGAWVDRLPREEFIAMCCLEDKNANAKG